MSIFYANPSEMLLLEKTAYTPFCKLLRILEFMSIAAGITGTGFKSCAGIHSKFKSLTMDIVSQRFHSIRKLFHEFHPIGDL